MKAILPVILLILAMPTMAYAQSIIVNYEKNHTIELYTTKNVSVQFRNNGTIPIEIGFGTLEAWMDVSESSFLLNTSNATKVRNITAIISPVVDLGTFTKKIPYTVSWSGGMSDHDLIFLIKTIEPQTGLGITMFIEEFEIPIFESDIGVMKIVNNGTSTALNVTFWDEYGWLEFDENYFDLDVNETKVIEFLVMPNLTRTIDTNKTYNLSMFANAENTPQYNISLSIFIPYFDFGNLTCDFFFEQQQLFKVKKEFCNAHPTASECLTSPIEVERNVTVYVKESCNLENLTQADMNAYGVCMRYLDDTQIQLDQCLSNLTVSASRIGVIENLVLGLGGQWTILGLLILMLMFAGIGYGVLWVWKRWKG